MKLSLIHLRMLALAGSFILGLSSVATVQAGSSEHGKCSIDASTDTVTCTHDGSQWTCRYMGSQMWSCTSTFAAWSTDCPSCVGSSRPTSGSIYRF